MKSLVLILTALHVLAHGVFGCCDHGVLASLAAVEDHCVCHHADDLQDRHSHDALLPEGWIEGDTPSRSPHECFHASCHWMTGDAAASAVALDEWAPLAMVAMLPVDPFTRQATESSFAMAPISISAPPLRLHLALGVILA